MNTNQSGSTGILWNNFQKFKLGHYLRFRLLAIECAFHYVSSMSVKEQVLQAIHRLPDDIDFRDVAEEIAFLAAVREAERDIEEGRLLTNEQMQARITERTTITG